VSELHKFVFEGLPVRGAMVRLGDAWQEMLAARAQAGGYARPVSEMLGQMCAAAVLMQSNIKFNGALVFQVSGDGPVPLAVAEVQPDFRVRATATVRGDIPEGARLNQLVNAHGQGRCAITLDPKDRLPGQQPYQGVVPLSDDSERPFEQVSDALEYYMRQSEQLDTCLVLAANTERAVGILIQRMPVTGQDNLAQQSAVTDDQDAQGASEDFDRIAMLTRSMTADELLSLDADTVLHRLFWDEPIARLLPTTGVVRPRFACTCSRERVGNMLRNLGAPEVDSIIEEQGSVSVGCEFCGAQYAFDPIDAAALFVPHAHSANPEEDHPVQ
jgi:molecular chaperone Hsp33